ncbi:MAG TPA: MFS transporter [Gemmataceae bacterium]|nr:MFS transporter [Gemmataceae bacterium]
MSELDTQPADSTHLAPDGETAPVNNTPARKAMFVVVLVMFIDLLGFGIVLPLLPRYGESFLKPVLGQEYAWLEHPLLGLLMASFSAMQFLFAPLWGRLSDRVGRRPFLLLGLTGSVVFYGLFGFASDWGEVEGRQLIGLILLFVARIGQGVAGATVSTAQAVIADCTTPEKRSRGMALIGAAFGVGFTFGPLIGALALVLAPAHPGGPGYAAAAISGVALVLAVGMMPETLRPGSTAGHRRGWLNVGGLRLALDTPTVALLILTFFLATLAFASFEPTLALVTKDVLRYSDEGNFLVFAYVGVVLMFAQGGLYQVLARRGVSEISFMLAGAALMAVGLGSLGGVSFLASRGPDAPTHGQLLGGVLAAVAVAVVGFAFLTPSVQALISRRSDPGRQGEILGVNQSANAMSRILGPVLGLGLYGVLPSHALPNVFSVVLLLAVVLLTLRARHK